MKTKIAHDTGWHADKTSEADWSRTVTFADVPTLEDIEHLRSQRKPFPVTSIGFYVRKCIVTLFTTERPLPKPEAQRASKEGPNHE